MSDNVLKKEFKQSDVQRVRNIVNKNYTAKTKLQSGYSKKTNKHKEGDVWKNQAKPGPLKTVSNKTLLSLMQLRNLLNYL